MSAGTQRIVFRWIHILFGFPIFGFIYGPQEEVAQYLPMYRYVFVPILVLSGLLLWKGHLLTRLFAKR
ncbi:MAG: hypothetical protein EOP83_25180 [Verrucomicrobiaceae bacterium]|nr:MAG: hypothetical protein EOP83_25180 [Verrucomicrobiaceae bacterium]